MMNKVVLSLEAYNAFHAYKTAMEENAVLLQDGRVCSVVPKDEFIEELRDSQIKLRKEYDELFINANQAMHDRDLYKSQISTTTNAYSNFTMVLIVMGAFFFGYVVHIIKSIL